MGRRTHRARSQARVWRAADLGRLLLDALRMLAAIWLVITVSMAGCVMIARLAGWHTTVVVSGSMRPAVDIGDLVMADPGAAPRAKPGQIVLVRRPGTPGQLLTHRVSQVLPGGSLITRGDANPVDDPQPVPPREVLGVVRAVVPQLGRSTMLARRHSPGDLAWVGLLLAAAALTVVQPRPARRSRPAGRSRPTERSHPAEPSPAERSHPAGPHTATPWHTLITGDVAVPDGGLTGPGIHPRSNRLARSALRGRA